MRSGKAPMKADEDLALQRRAILYFLLLAFGSTWVLWTALWLMKIGPAQTLEFAIFGTGGMYLPGVSALIVRRFVLERICMTARYFGSAWQGSIGLHGSYFPR